MKKQYLATLLLCAAIVGLQTVEAWRTPSRLEDREKLHDSWHKFKTHFPRKHATGDEEDLRFKLFAERYHNIINHNIKYERGEVSYKQGINQFSDWTDEEVEDMKNAKMAISKPIMTGISTGHSAYLDSLRKLSVPDTIDWRALGAVTPIKRQGCCGSCYAHGAAVVMEGAVFLKTGQLKNLSVQQVIDCDQYTNGCSGSWSGYVIKYWGEIGYAVTMDAYPYEGVVRGCRLTDSMERVNISLASHNVIYDANEADMKNLVATVGPIGTGMDVDFPGFMSYAGGLFDHRTCDNAYTNHAMAIVGYGTEAGKDYWLIKNSWGTDWGEQGYLRMARNANNQCGLANYPYWVALK